jgi:hypothetical protein
MISITFFADFWGAWQLQQRGAIKIDRTPFKDRNEMSVRVTFTD